jgi:hypothetical protein
MRFLSEHRIGITTDASGDSTDTTVQSIHGLLYAVDVVDGTLVDNFDLTITYTSPDGVSKTLLTLTNLTTDITYYPREQVHGNTGTGLTLDGTRIAFGPPLVAGVVTCVTAQGGATKTGAIVLHVIE